MTHEEFERVPEPPVYWQNRVRDLPVDKPFCPTEFEMAILAYASWWVAERLRMKMHEKCDEVRISKEWD